MKKTNIFGLLLLLLFAKGSFGQDSSANNNFSLSMQLRPRLEYRDGYSRPLSDTEKPAALISSRLRLNADYAYSDILKTKISLQNISLWGQTAAVQGISTTNNNLNVYEAWADLKIYKGLRTRIGRQAILLDDQRLFSVADWTQGGRSHDALSVYFQSKKWDIKTFFAFNQNYNMLYNGNLNNPSGNLYNTTDAQNYKLMQTFWAAYQFSKNNQLSFLFTNIGFQNTDPAKPAADNTIANLQTTGLNYTLTRKDFQIKLTGYCQFGKDPQQATVSAYLLSGGITGNFSSSFKMGIRSDYYSGNAINQSSTTDHAFNHLFGTDHPFYGQMDYFPYSNVGLWNNVLDASYLISPKVNVAAALHFYTAAQDFQRNNEQYAKNLGQELDLNFNYKINAFIALQAGYSAYLSNANTAALKNVTNTNTLQHWTWVSLNVTPQLFRSKF